MSHKTFSYRSLYELIREGGVNIGDSGALIELLTKNHSILNNEESRKNCSRFFSNLKQKWQSAARSHSVFIKQNESWFNGTVSFDLESDISAETVKP